jgi:hypothetical protein
MPFLCGAFVPRSHLCIVKNLAARPIDVLNAGSEDSDLRHCASNCNGDGKS